MFMLEILGFRMFLFPVIIFIFGKFVYLNFDFLVYLYVLNDKMFLNKSPDEYR